MDRSLSVSVIMLVSAPFRLLKLRYVVVTMLDVVDSLIRFICEIVEHEFRLLLKRCPNGRWALSIRVLDSTIERLLRVEDSCQPVVQHRITSLRLEF